MDNSTDEELYHGLDNILRHYIRAICFMKHIHCDREFKSIMDKVADKFAYKLDISMNYANPDNHAPDIERNNRVVQ